MKKEVLCNVCGETLDFKPVSNIIICPSCTEETSISIKEV